MYKDVHQRRFIYEIYIKLDIKQNGLRDFHLIYHISRYQHVDFIFETLVGVKIIFFLATL